MGTNAARETTEGQKMDVPASKTKSSEIYTYEAEHPLFALGWSVRLCWLLSPAACSRCRAARTQSIVRCIAAAVLCQFEQRAHADG